MTLTQERVDKIIESHGKWWRGEPGGQRANLSGANLRCADLNGADMMYANLMYANLGSANLMYANLSGANLSGANLSGANLSGANLSGANLSGAYLKGAKLICANLSGADLSEANLKGAYLSEANLKGANLSGAIGLLKQTDFISQFEKTPEGIIVYKTFNGSYRPPEGWNITPGSVIEETPNPDRCCLCGCGINVGPLEWVKKNYGTKGIWKCLIRWEWLAGVVIPFNTDGKFRVEKLELLEELKEDTSF